MNHKISFAGPSITEKEVSYVLDAVQNGWYEHCEDYIKRLEKAFAEYVGVKYAIAVHCCTHALHLACAALGLGEDDEVIVTDFSWVATAHAVAYTGAKCVFADVEPDTWTIDPDCVRKAITPRTRAIMLVHSFGQPAMMDEIMKIAEEYGLFVIEDAAPAVGAEYHGKKVGSFGDFSCFSFQGAKMTVSGEGGVLLTDSEDLYRKAYRLSDMGRTDRKAVFWSDELGYQYTISNLSAALALAQLERVEDLIQKKRNLFERYDSNLGEIGKIRLVREREGCRSNYCYPSLLLPGVSQEKRDRILEELRARNIHARPAFPRMSRFPMYEQRFDNPVCAAIEQKGICLPSAANMTDEDVDFVCDTFLELL
ncbi:DegT/DnrJ/EryC1/StrS family aminotransferase [Caproicibacter sp.]|uniref:DegT/DnrJ/EryC1/StrS family aminotransferase n=1 Tax=Caproicibacter sp. TaxID=2814884 RepID=UPI003989AAAC